MCHIFAGQDPDDYEPETRRMRLNGRRTTAAWQVRALGG